MSFLDDLYEAAQAERMATLDQRQKIGSGDFQGSVAATWVKLNEEGLAVVEYNGKKYKAIRTGSTSLFPGSTVMLSYADGVYFADW